jgi:polyisoprenoid-binding protein YceI
MKKAIIALTGLVLFTGLSSFTLRSAKAEASLTVNTEKSRIDWVAAKKSDFHTGIFPLKSGSVTVDGGKLKGGKFVIDLANLKVTDAGGGDRLTGHLKSADFFDVAKFAEATYEITGVNYTDASNADVTGNLTVKGLTVPVKLKAQIRNSDEKGFFAQAFLTLDKTLVGINYGTGNVANDVQLAIHLFAK